MARPLQPFVQVRIRHVLRNRDSSSHFNDWFPPSVFFPHLYFETRCVPKYRVCLSDSSDCPQYECVGRPAPCDKNSVEPVCDTNGLVHLSLCHLRQAGKTLAYMGQCQVRWAGLLLTDRFGVTLPRPAVLLLQEPVFYKSDL